MQYLLFLLAFIAGTLFTAILDRVLIERKRSRGLKQIAIQRQLIAKLEAEGWQRPWIS